MSNNFMETYSGLRPVIGAIKSDQVSLSDIVISLSRINRYVGHTSQPYTVLEHAMHCARVAKALGYDATIQMACLMHDSKEAYVCDMPTPVKRAFAELCPGFAAAKKAVELDADVAICEMMGDVISPVDMRRPQVVGVDIGMLRYEAERLVKSGGEGWTYTVDPANVGAVYDEPLAKYPVEMWIVEFMTLYMDLMKQLESDRG